MLIKFRNQDIEVIELYKWNADFIINNKVKGKFMKYRRSDLGIHLLMVKWVVQSNVERRDY